MRFLASDLAAQFLRQKIRIGRVPGEEHVPEATSVEDCQDKRAAATSDCFQDVSVWQGCI